MIIGKANHSETKYIINFSQKVIRESSMGYIDTKQIDYVDLFGPFLDNGAYYLIAKKDEKIVGWLLIGSSMDQFTFEQIGVLLDIYVIPQYRKLGIAKRLMNEALTILKQQKLTKVQLSIFAGNSSRKLCDQFGFKEVLTVFKKSI